MALGIGEDGGLRVHLINGLYKSRSRNRSGRACSHGMRAGTGRLWAGLIIRVSAIAARLRMLCIAGGSAAVAGSVPDLFLEIIMRTGMPAGGRYRVKLSAGRVGRRRVYFLDRARRNFFVVIIITGA